MSRRRDPLRLNPHWHVDYRLEADLPEDSVVGAHFFTHVAFGAFTLAVALLSCWLAYRITNLRGQVGEWDRRIAESLLEVKEVQSMQREYVAEASKIDQAYAAIRGPVYFSGFLTRLAETLPAQVTVDMIDWTEAGIIIRGVIRESKQRAPILLGNYVRTLSKDEKVGSNFVSIKITGMAPSKNTDEIHGFELTFQPSPLPSL